MATEAAIVLPLAEMLDVQLGGRMIDHLSHYPRPLDQGLTNARIITGLVE
jgi:hypothetical protein